MVTARRAGVALAVLLLAAGSSLHAQDAGDAQPVPPQAVQHTGVGAADAREQARELFERGVELTAKHRLTEAVEAFRASAQLVPRASTLYNLGLSLFRLGRYRECLEAVEELQPLLAGDAADAHARERAVMLQERARAQLATVELRVQPPDAELSIDGQTLAGTGEQRTLQLDPGRHRLRLTAERHAEQSRELQLAAGDSAQLAIELAPLPEPVAAQASAAPRALGSPEPAAPAATPEAPSRIGPYALMIGGGALLGAAAVTGVLAKREDDAFRGACDGGYDDCPPELEDDASSVRRLAIATDVLLGLGVAAGAAGVIWWLAVDGEQGGVQAGLYPGGGAVRGRF